MAKINAHTTIQEDKGVMIERKLLGLSKLGDSAEDEKAYIALKYFDKKYECFSEWDSDDLKNFSNTVDKINSLTWKEIKGHSGLRLKKIDNAKGIPNSAIKNQLSKDIMFYEIRISKKARIIGFRSNAVFFLCWLDRNHRICGQ